MKKAFIALSVAAGMIGVAQAENTTTLYGSLGVSTQVTKNTGSSVANALDKNVWDLNTYSSKFGIKGTEDLSNGVQAFYKMEFNFSNNNGVDTTRYAYLGLTGSFGTVTFGKQDSLYKVVTNFNDIFEDVYFNDGVAHFGTSTGGSRIGKTISYVSPSFGGFQFGVAGVLDGSHEIVAYGDKRDFNAAQAGLWYKANGFYAGAAYSWMDQDVVYNPYDGQTYAGPNAIPGYFGNKGSTEVYGGAVGFENDNFHIGLGAEHQSSLGEVYNLAGAYYYGPNTFRAGFALADYDDESNIYNYALGYQYNFSKRTYTWVEGSYTDWNVDGIDNGYTVKVGLRHNF